MAAKVKVNQVAYDFYSMEVEISASGETFGIIKGVEEIEYNTTINREKLYGGSRTPVDRTEGDAEHEGSMSFHKNWDQYIHRRAKELRIGIANLEMVIAVSYFANNELQTDTLTKVKFSEIGNSHSRSPDPLMVTKGLDILNIYYDGVDVFGARLR